VKITIGFLITLLLSSIFFIGCAAFIPSYENQFTEENVSESLTTSLNTTASKQMLETTIITTNQPNTYSLNLTNFKYFLTISYWKEELNSWQYPYQYHYTIIGAVDGFLFSNVVITYLWNDEEKEIYLDSDGFAQFSSLKTLDIYSIEGLVEYPIFIDINNKDEAITLDNDNYEEFISISESRVSFGIRYIYEYYIDSIYYDTLFVDATITYIDRNNEEQTCVLNAGGYGFFSSLEHKISLEYDVIDVSGYIYLLPEKIYKVIIYTYVKFKV
jgi:hypothetical protein